MTRLVLAVLVALVAIYGLHIWRAPFVYEDARYLEGTDRPFQAAGLMRGRGLTTESWTVIRSPQASHALNLGLHLIVVWLTGVLLWQLTSLPVALAVAAVLALHPLTIETVAYASSRGELIAAVGVLLALACVAAPLVWPWAFLPLAVTLAYLGKETGLIVLALIPLVWWMQGKQQWAARITAACAGGIVLVLTCAPLVLRDVMHLAVGEYTAMSWQQWGLIQSVAVWRLVVLSVAPIWLSVAPVVDHLPGLLPFAAVLLLAGLLECAWRLRRTSPLATFGLLGCALVAVPRLLVRTPWSPMNEHQWYLAMPFVACVIVAGLRAVGDWFASCKREWPCLA